MIQRIQSVFLFLAGVLFGSSFATSFASSDRAVEGIFSDQLYRVNDHVGLQILAGLGILLSLAAIFLYKNRKNQVKLGYIITTIAILLPIAAILIYSNQTEQLEAAVIEDRLGLYLPIGTVICTLLAVRFIRKDEKLVQSMDRLR